jgi:hypothetical protein
MIRAITAQLLAGALSISCSLLTTFDENKLSEDTFERCRDRVDNDSDGLTDCDDPGCAPFPFCTELTTIACTDGVDNDGDGLTDCKDPGCIALRTVCVEETPAACVDGVDNDSDGLTDCDDPDCQRLDICQEKSDAACVDGVDNNHNGLVDCADFDCYDTPSCCTKDVPLFDGDDFTFASSCTARECQEGEASCCKPPYNTCNTFDPARWVPWGVPRARQQDGFTANNPCGCDSSGIVSVENVALKPGLEVVFDLDLASAANPLASICAGLTRSTLFADGLQQCSNTPQPRLLVGLCLEWPAGGDRRVVAIVDGSVEAQHPAPGTDVVIGAIRVAADGVYLLGGPLSHHTTPMDATLGSALMLVSGRGTSGRISHITAKQPEIFRRRCQDPATWYRHLSRGEPVVAAQSKLAFGQPTVAYLADSSSFLMLVAGTGTADGGLYSATSDDGMSWSVSAKPVISATQAAFGTRQLSPSLLFRQGTYHVWYTREEEVGTVTQRTIAHATSADGVTWTPDEGPGGQHFVLGPTAPPAWDSLSVSAPSVIEAEDGSLLMWYTGAALELAPRPAIGAARSDDGRSWTRLRLQPVLAPDPDSAELACEEPTVTLDRSGVFHMWYTHRSFGQPSAIHFAVSANGLAWLRWPKGAVLQAGALGAFDERGVEAPAVLGTDPVHLWYTGINSKGMSQIGYVENRGSR